MGPYDASSFGLSDWTQIMPISTDPSTQDTNQTPDTTTPSGSAPSNLGGTDWTSALLGGLTGAVVNGVNNAVQIASDNAVVRGPQGQAMAAGQAASAQVAVAQISANNKTFLIIAGLVAIYLLTR